MKFRFQKGGKMTVSAPVKYNIIPETPLEIVDFSEKKPNVELPDLNIELKGLQSDVHHVMGTARQAEQELKALMAQDPSLIFSKEGQRALSIIRAATSPEMQNQLRRNEERYDTTKDIMKSKNNQAEWVTRANGDIYVKKKGGYEYVSAEELALDPTLVPVTNAEYLRERDEMFAFENQGLDGIQTVANREDAWKQVRVRLDSLGEALKSRIREFASNLPTYDGKAVDFFGVRKIKDSTKSNIFSHKIVVGEDDQGKPIEETFGGALHKAVAAAYNNLGEAERLALRNQAAADVRSMLRQAAVKPTKDNEDLQAILELPAQEQAVEVSRMIQRQMYNNIATELAPAERVYIEEGDEFSALPKGKGAGGSGDGDSTSLGQIGPITAAYAGTSERVNAAVQYASLTNWMSPSTRSMFIGAEILDWADKTVTLPGGKKYINPILQTGLEMAANLGQLQFTDGVSLDDLKEENGKSIRTAFIPEGAKPIITWLPLGENLASLYNYATSVSEFKVIQMASQAYLTAVEKYGEGGSYLTVNTFEDFVAAEIDRQKGRTVREPKNSTQQSIQEAKKLVATLTTAIPNLNQSYTAKEGAALLWSEISKKNGLKEKLELAAHLVTPIIIATTNMDEAVSLAQGRGNKFAGRGAIKLDGEELTQAVQQFAAIAEGTGGDAGYYTGMLGRTAEMGVEFYQGLAIAPMKDENAVLYADKELNQQYSALTVPRNFFYAFEQEWERDSNLRYIPKTSSKVPTVADYGITVKKSN